MRDKGKWLDYTNRGLSLWTETHHHRTQEQNPQEQPLTVNSITKTFGRRNTTPGFNKIHTKVGDTVNNHKENKLCEERNQERREIEERGEKTRKAGIAFGRLSGEARRKIGSIRLIEGSEGDKYRVSIMHGRDLGGSKSTVEATMGLLGLIREEAQNKDKARLYLLGRRSNQ
ncbi:hypothetical protein Dimus_005979, partial [Dionaea muscipula]